MQVDEQQSGSSPSSSSFLSEELLFFDTFSHSESGSNFDLVQFPSPVFIDLIKIVPLGQPIEAKIPGNVRLGATNPSKCELEFFINDLSKHDAHTFADLGKFCCSENETDFVPTVQIQTDGLLLRGSYRTLTLAIFGQIATFEEKQDEVEEIVEEPTISSPPAQTPASPVCDDRTTAFPATCANNNQTKLDEDEIQNLRSQLNARHCDYEYSPSVKSDETPKEKNPKLKTRQEHETACSNAKQIVRPHDYKSRTTNYSSDDASRDSPAINKRTSIEDTNLSDDFDHESSKHDRRYSSDVSKQSRDKYRKTTSNRHRLEQDKQDILDRQDNQESPIRGEEVYDDEDELITSWNLNIKTYSPQPLTYFPDPSLTPQERFILSEKKTRSNSEYNNSVDKELKRMKDAFIRTSCEDGSKSEDWVLLIEAIVNDISSTTSRQFLDSDIFLDYLIQEVCHGLNFEMALHQKSTAFKMRHLRAGLKLATILFHCGDTAVGILLKYSIPFMVLRLYEKEQMTLPIKSLIFRCLNAACDSTIALNHIISHNYIWMDSKLNLKSFKQLLCKANRSKFKDKNDSGEQQQNHANFEAIDIQSDTGSPDVPAIPDKKTSDSDSDSDHYRAENEKDSNDHTCYQYMLKILLSNPKTRISVAIGNLFKKIKLHKDLNQLSKVSKFEDISDEEEEKSDVERLHLLKSVISPLQSIISLMKNGCIDITQPVRHIPAKVQFQARPYHSDPYLTIYKWIKQFDLLDCIDTLLRRLWNMNPPDYEMEDFLRIQCLCIELLQDILDSPRGPHMLLSFDCYKKTGSILKLLTNNEQRRSKQTSHLRLDGLDSFAKIKAIKDHLLFDRRCKDFALRTIFSLEVYSNIDLLFSFHKESIDGKQQRASFKPTVSDPELILHKILVISDHPYGLSAILRHFTFVGNLDCLLRFIDMPDFNKNLEFVKEIVIDYSLELIGLFVKLNNNVLEISDEYLDTLIELKNKTKDSTSSRIGSLIPWLTPFDINQPQPLITYSEETFKLLVKVLRKSIPNTSIPFAKGFNYELPPQMITAVRILRQLSIAPQIEFYLTETFDSYSSIRFVEKFRNKSSLSMPFVDSFPHSHNVNLSWNFNNNNINNINNTNNDNNNQRQVLNRIEVESNLTGIEESCLEEQGQVTRTFKLFQPYDEDIVGELKYHFAIMQLIEQDGLKRLLNTLRELIGNYPKPKYQSVALCGVRGRIVLSYIDSVVVLLHSIICHLIDARGSDFKDTTVIPVALETYSLLCFTPKPDLNLLQHKQRTENSVNNFDCENDIDLLRDSCNLELDNWKLAQQTKKLLLSILMSYTQLCLSVSESEEKVISKSLWTKMLKEVISFTMSSPIFFKHGLEILTKILPAPLPGSSVLDSIDQTQLFKSINHRKLWSAHLHPLHQSVELLISSLSICCDKNVRDLLCYFCYQLCDLSSTAACMVVRTVIDTMIGFSLKAHRKTLNNNSTNASSSNQTKSGDISDLQGISQTQQSTTASDAILSTDDSKYLDQVSPHWATSKEALSYLMTLLLGLVSNLMTNKSFETAFGNYFHAITRKDEQITSALYYTLGLFDSFSPKQFEDTRNSVTYSSSYNTTSNSNNNNNSNINNSSGTGLQTCKLLDDLLAVANSIKQSNRHNDPPEEMTKCNLMELSRKTSDRFSLSSGLKKSYRLKVLLDLTSNFHHRPTTDSLTNRRGFDNQQVVPPRNQSPSTRSSYSSETQSSLPASSMSSARRIQSFNSSSGSQSSLAPPPLPHPASMHNSSRSRGRASGDAFRSRALISNSSRPASIHVDDFMFSQQSAPSQSSRHLPPTPSSSSRYISSGGGSSSNISRSKYPPPSSSSSSRRY